MEVWEVLKESFTERNVEAVIADLLLKMLIAWLSLALILKATVSSRN